MPLLNLSAILMDLLTAQGCRPAGLVGAQPLRGPQIDPCTEAGLPDTMSTHLTLARPCHQREMSGQ